MIKNIMVCSNQWNCMYPVQTVFSESLAIRGNVHKDVTQNSSYVELFVWYGPNILTKHTRRSNTKLLAVIFWIVGNGCCF